MGGPDGWRILRPLTDSFRRGRVSAFLPTLPDRSAFPEPCQEREAGGGLHPSLGARLDASRSSGAPLETSQAPTWYSNRGEENNGTPSSDEIRYSGAVSRRYEEEREFTIM